MLLCLALETPRASLGTFLVMVEPAATKAFSPTVTGATRLALQPIKAPSSMLVRYFFLPS